jgi:hypothetical protein
MICLYGYRFLDRIICARVTMTLIPIKKSRVSALIQVNPRFLAGRKASMFVDAHSACLRFDRAAAPVNMAAVGIK